MRASGKITSKRITASYNLGDKVHKFLPGNHELLDYGEKCVTKDVKDLCAELFLEMRNVYGAKFLCNKE